MEQPVYSLRVADRTVDTLACSSFESEHAACWRNERKERDDGNDLARGKSGAADLAAPFRDGPDDAQPRAARRHAGAARGGVLRPACVARAPDQRGRAALR